MRMFPNGRSRPRGPAGTTVVESYCSMIAGPSIRSPPAAARARRTASSALGPAVDVEDDLALERLRRGRVAVAGLELGRLELVDPPDPDGAHVDDLDLARRTGGRTRPRARGGSAASSSTQAVVDRARRNLEAHLVSLARVAAVGEAADEAPVLGNAVRLELGDRLRDELVETARSRSWSRLLSAWRSVATNSCWRSVASRPVAAMIPGCGGTSTRGISSSSAMSHANSGPAPPAATSVNSRGS